MKQSSSNKAMIAVICVGIIIIFTIVAVMLAKGGTKDSDDNENGEFIGPLPDSLVGIWELPGDSHVLQSPRTADMTEDEALADENDFGVTLTYGVYSTNRVGSIENPTYILEENCGTEAMDEQGMQSGGVLEEFADNPSVTKIEVYDEEGSSLCDTVFIINDTYLVYFGTGNYVFCAVKLEAVG